MLLAKLQLMMEQHVSMSPPQSVPGSPHLSTPQPLSSPLSWSPPQPVSGSPSTLLLPSRSPLLQMSAMVGEERTARNSHSPSSTSTFSSSLPPDENLNGRLVDFTPRQSSALRSPTSRKAKRVRFYRNGDKFYKGVVIAVTPERYRSFDSLVADLTRALVDNVNIPSGVRTLFTMDGRKVCCLDELEDGKCYVCSGLGETFKKVDYSTSSSLIAKPKNRRSISASQPQDSQRNKTCLSDVIRPHVITLIRNGTRPRRVVRLLLNKRNAPSFDQALSSITEAVKLDTGAVRKVFTLSGVQVNRLEEFFGSNDIFFVYGNERYSKDDFDLDLEEYKLIQSQCKTSSSFHNAAWDSCLSLKFSQYLPGSQEECGGVRLSTSMPKMPVKTKAVPEPSSVSSDSYLALPPSIKFKYQVGRIIGDGNFAVVRHCVERSSGTEYAMKIIEKSKCYGKEHMIESEVSILRQVRHPNIIQLVAEYNFHGELYLVMELVKGGDLFDAIAQATKFSEREASIMTRNLASALLYLHGMNIVHRDIKPENLLVEMDSNGTRLLKLGDFGLAQRVMDPLYTVCGTPTYVAPEILAETGYGLKIDVWAAGVILYILLCGFPPFVSATNDQEELFDKILSGLYEFSSPYWDDVSHLAKHLISHMLQVQPELRFSAEDVLDHLWLAEAGGEEQLTVHRAPSLPTNVSLQIPDLTFSAVSR
ncbi:serine/threonine-protein kinase GD17699-like isoform X2 [Bacillus rossius redtenbacheri]|uniref:serine/threonine-protein kinase GD17699-like isoform X2 n=2 Tax=Bacillus rossius redtenbacheri TaxID=93214 RepID=UPI002FDEF034